MTFHATESILTVKAQMPMNINRFASSTLNSHFLSAKTISSIAEGFTSSHNKTRNDKL